MRVLGDGSNENHETVMAYHTQFQEFFSSWNDGNSMSEALLATKIYCDGEGDGEGDDRDILMTMAKAQIGALNALFGRGDDSEEGGDRHCAPKRVTILDALDKSLLADLPKAMTSSGQKMPAATGKPKAAVKPSAVAKPPPPADATVSRRFEYIDDLSSKFWCISMPGPAETKVQFGKIGSAGSFQDKTHASAEQARKFVNKMIKQKTNKGYEEVPSEPCCNVTVAAAARAIQEEDDDAAAVGGGAKRKATNTPSSENTFVSRRFVCIDDHSQKFWCISIPGTPEETKVHYGKIGAVGVYRTKTHDTAEKALKHVDKMVKEKINKGYGEVPPKTCCGATGKAAKK